MTEVKFAVFTDLHYDVIPDGDSRIKEFITHIEKRGDMDFIIELGDMCHPVEENRIILGSLEKAGIPCYHTLCNHDSESFLIEQVMSFLDMKNNYYSFVKGELF